MYVCLLGAPSRSSVSHKKLLQRIELYRFVQEEVETSVLRLLLGVALVAHARQSHYLGRWRDLGAPFSNSRILRAASKPSMTGIDKSRKIVMNLLSALSGPDAASTY